jgi:hypothetical protein
VSLPDLYVVAPTQRENIHGSHEGKSKYTDYANAVKRKQTATERYNDVRTGIRGA